MFVHICWLSCLVVWFVARLFGWWICAFGCLVVILLVGCLVVCSAGWFVGWPTIFLLFAGLLACLVGGFARFGLFGWLPDWLVGWLVCCFSFVWLFGRLLVGWLIACYLAFVWVVWVVWLVGWLADRIFVDLLCVWLVVV